MVGMRYPKSTKMAVKWNLFQASLYIFWQISLGQGQLPAIPLQDVSDCNVVGPIRQYYDTTKLACQSCSQDETFQVTSPDGESRHVLK